MKHPYRAGFTVAVGAALCLPTLAVTTAATAHEGQRRGVLIAESIWPNDAFEDGQGINTLTGCDQPAPNGGGAFHDNRVWMRAA